MWGFSEKDIERFLTRPKRGRQKPVITIDDISYVVLWTQPELVVMEDSQPSAQQPLFQELSHLKHFLPSVEGKCQVPDIIAYRKPKGDKELVIFELKNADATDRHVAQLRRYVNLLSYYLDHNIEEIRKKLGLGAGRYRARGILLARSIPKVVWLAACVPYDDKRADIELIAYELESSQRKRQIQEIRFHSFTGYYRKEFQKTATKYRKNRRRPKRGLLGSVDAGQPGLTADQSPGPAENGDYED